MSKITPLTNEEKAIFNAGYETCAFTVLKECQDKLEKAENALTKISEIHLHGDGSRQMRDIAREYLKTKGK